MRLEPVYIFTQYSHISIVRSIRRWIERSRSIEEVGSIFLTGYTCTVVYTDGERARKCFNRDGSEFNKWVC